MRPAPAKAPEATAFEDLGRATLQIVHDLKNQLNGLKLYATYLRKRLDREDQPPEERETLLKLIAGLDRAAREMTALVRYARPIEVHPRSGTDLRAVVLKVIEEASSKDTGGLSPAPLVPNIPADPILGEFDAAALHEAFKEVTDEAQGTASSKQPASLSLRVQVEGSHVRLEWHGGNRVARTRTFMTERGHGSIHTAIAAKIIEAHGGELQLEGDVIKASLPLPA